MSSAAETNLVLIPDCVALYPSAIARCVFPTPDGPNSTTFSERSTNAKLDSSLRSCFGAPVAKSKSNCSSVLMAGKPAIRVSCVRLPRRHAASASPSSPEINVGKDRQFVRDQSCSDLPCELVVNSQRMLKRFDRHRYGQ